MLKSTEEKRSWNVEVAPAALIHAIAQIEGAYSGSARKDMLAWLERFVLALYEDPMSVLGSPPMQVVSDPDMMVFPGDKRVKISGLAHLSKTKRLIHVFEIHVQMPGESGRRMK
jgi:hypothetical protein